MQDWLWMEAAELGAGIARGEIDPLALTEVYLAAIDSHADSSRIYARTTPDRAWAEARAASLRARNGARLHPLDGVPVSWKDLFDSAGRGDRGRQRPVGGAACPTRTRGCCATPPRRGWSAWARRICRNWRFQALG